MVESQTSGELALIRLMHDGVLVDEFLAEEDARHIATVSAARSGWVTEPMNGLSDQRMCA